ncbi:LacI family DNA-binding transcriptional regulator [Shimia sediminis]|uniref:LacI family DNA-binding transcriptional regulator n=1 Tax=Shimia sediminis TaxID=2497945 RepID=UPI000F8DF5BB|nr:LacI family DNA-binding transcriptional regulator [Shimia sediminis]
MPKPTLSQIAKELGVSTATVSLAMKENSRISDATRSKVLKAMRESGYVYQRSAAGLRKAKTDTVGIILNNVSDPFYSTLLAEIERALAEEGRTAFLCNTNESLDRQAEFIRKMSEYNADGIILVPAIGTEPVHLEQFKEIAPPIVCATRTVAGYPIDAVVLDDAEGGRMATRHLVNLGHRRIAIVGGVESISSFRDRLTGHRMALDELGLPFEESLVFEMRPVRKSGFDIAPELVESPVAATAAIGYNAIVTLGLKAGLQKAGVLPGRDFALIASENVEELQLTSPALSTISLDDRNMGRSIVNLLMERIQNPETEPQTLLLPPELLVRESCNPCQENNTLPKSGTTVRLV